MHGDLDPEERVLNWKEQYLGMKPGLSNRQIELLTKGPDSLSSSWLVGAMFNDWARITGYKSPEPPNCQSNLKDSLKMFDDYSLLKPLREHLMHGYLNIQHYLLK